MIDICTVEWSKDSYGYFADLGEYRIFTVMCAGSSYVNFYRVGFDNGFFLIKSHIPIPNWLANSLPEFSPGLMLDWLADQGIG